MNEVAWSGCATADSVLRLPWMDAATRSDPARWTSEEGEEAEEKNKEEEEDGCNRESNGGNSDNSKEPCWLLASVDASNILQVWRYAADVAPQIYDNDENREKVINSML